MYDPVRDKFINFYPRKNDSVWIQSKTVWFIREDKSGNVWLVGLDGEVSSVNMSELLNDIDPDSLRRHIRFRTYRAGPPGNRIWDLESWEERSVIVSTYRGCFVIDPATGKTSRPHLSLSASTKLDTTAKVILLRESRTALWIGTQTGELFRLDERNGMLRHYPTRSGVGHDLNIAIVYTMQMDAYGNLWLATTSGYQLFDTASGMYRDFLFSPPNGPVYEGVEMKLSLDNCGTLWISAGESGLYYLHRRSKLYAHYGLRDTSRKALEMGTIENWSDSSLWIDVEGKAVNVDPTTLHVRRVAGVLKGERPQFVRSGTYDSYNDGKGNIWYGTWGLGFYKFEPASGRVTNFRASAQLPDQAKDICWSLTGGNGDTLWIAANTGGVILFDRRTNRYSRPTDSLLLKLTNVSDVMKDNQGRIWVSDQRRGLFVVGPSGKTVEHFEHDPNEPTSIAFNNVRKTYQDQHGRVWVGGVSLELWDSVARSFRHFPNDRFSQTNLVEPMGSDTRGRLWVRFSGAGLAVLDPETGHYTNFDWSDGLAGNVITMSLLPDGRVALVGQNGLNIVDPDSLRGENPAPPVVLCRITANDTLSVNEKNRSEAKALDLAYMQNVVEFEFAAIDPGVTHLIEYFYRLEGLEDAWVRPVDRRFVRYPGLSPGDYVLRVKAVNKFGRWPDQEIAFALSIAPPWWRTWWAYTSYGLLLVAFLFGGYRLRLRQIYLKQHADMEHFQAERLSEVDKLKSRFFANISHEFRTPLTLILGPADQMMESIQDPAARQKLDLIRNNANKLYGLVSQLLDFSKVESGTMKL